MSGRLNATFNGATDTVQVANSYIALPNTRLELNGALGRKIEVTLTSKNLNDFAPALKQDLPVMINGPATFTGSVMGTLSNPRIVGHLAMADFTVARRHFDRLAADVNAAGTDASLTNGLITRGPMQTQLEARIGLANWKPLPRSPITVNAAIRNGDVADILALAARGDIPARGPLTATVNLAGTFGNPTGSALLAIVNGAAYGEPIDRLDARVTQRHGRAVLQDRTRIRV